MERKKPAHSVLDMKFADDKLSAIIWKPVVHDYMTDVTTTCGLNFVKLIHKNPKLYDLIKNQEETLDRMRRATLSEIMPAVIEWRGLVLKAHFDERDTARKSV